MLFLLLHGKAFVATGEHPLRDPGTAATYKEKGAEVGSLDPCRVW